MPSRSMQSPYFASGDPETEEMTTLYAPGMLGTIAQFERASNNVCKYRLVKQNTGVTGIVGNVMGWFARATYTVGLGASGTLGLPAGICRIAAATAASYIWICTRGNRGVLFQGSPTVAPDATGAVQAVLGATGGQANGVSTANVALHLGSCTGVTASNIAPVQLSLLDADD
ncbi:MAG TPA: hypothetical protein VFO16_24185 [Pseudonocardiaceae bacterium]|nr:hypothetical protein [Pseudonocardiaceae bacterium]